MEAKAEEEEKKIQQQQQNEQTTGGQIPLRERCRKITFSPGKKRLLSGLGVRSPADTAALPSPTHSPSRMESRLYHVRHTQKKKKQLPACVNGKFTFWLPRQ